MNSVFFGESGLTSTSANYIANKAKEHYESLETDLKNIKFINADIQLITADTRIPKTRGITNPEAIATVIAEIAECKALCAWLREAIKHKEMLSDREAQYSLPEYLEHIGNRPMLGKHVTEIEMIEELPISERMRMLALQAKCATIGNFIHKGGYISNARKKAVEVRSNPISISEDGANTIITHYEVSVPMEKIDATFFQLQEEHRSAQAEYNGILHKVRETVRERNLNTAETYSKAYEEWENKCQLLSSKQKEERLKRTADVEKLKIVIPNNLKSIYDKIKNM
jgi:hypothetical protein